MKKFDKVKSHLKDNKNVYIASGIGATAATAGFLLGRKFPRLAPEDVTKLVAKNKNQALLIWKPTQNITQTVIRRGHPGFLVQCKETGEVFASIRRAAEMMKVDPTTLRRHLHGLVENVGGFTFEILGEAA